MSRWGRFLLFLLLPALLVAALLIWSPLLTVRRLDITGQKRTTTEEILAAADIRSGDHLFLPLRFQAGGLPETRLETVRGAVERLPWIASAKVEWVPLHDLRIRVTERVPYARLPYLGGYLLIDAEGVVLEKIEGEPDASLKELRGVTFTGYANGRRPDLTEPERMDAGLAILRALGNSRKASGPSLYDTVSWVDVLAEDRALISLEERIAIRLDPTGDLQYMLDFAGEIFFRHIRPEEKGMIDFTRGDDPSFIPD